VIEDSHIAINAVPFVFGDFQTLPDCGLAHRLMSSERNQDIE
jgi:hypothetical protein